MFMSGYFVLQQINGSFNAVSPDMKLKQSIQISQKSVHGIIGQTRKSKYVTEWELYITRYCQIIMFFAPFFVQILYHVSHTSIMNWLETTQKFTAATCTKYMNFWRAEETRMT